MIVYGGYNVPTHRHCCCISRRVLRNLQSAGLHHDCFGMVYIVLFFNPTLSVTFLTDLEVTAGSYKIVVKLSSIGVIFGEFSWRGTRNWHKYHHDAMHQLMLSLLTMSIALLYVIVVAGLDPPIFYALFSENGYFQTMESGQSHSFCATRDSKRTKLHHSNYTDFKTWKQVLDLLQFWLLRYQSPS